MGTFSIFAGSMVCKQTAELDAKLKIAALVGAGLLLILLPVLLAVFYGSDYKMGWVVVSALLSVLVSFYTYYDVVIFHDKKLFEENDFIMSALYVYIDFLWLIYYHVLKPCVEKGYDLARNNYQ
jgi:FtsH-binding integral membrane protein